jgi:DNA-binding transcriptional regulator YbjK
LNDATAPIDGRVARGQERRDEIARAVIDVVAAHGLRGLTHRRVAEAASVPLGSTTYHFETLDDLMLAGLELAADRNLAMMRRAAESLAPGDDVAVWLTDLVIAMVTTWRESNIAERELYLEAIRSPALRPVATRWDDAFVDILTSHLGDREGARLACWALDGLAITLLMAGTAPDRARILRQMTRLCADLDHSTP